MYNYHEIAKDMKNDTVTLRGLANDMARRTENGDVNGAENSRLATLTVLKNMIELLEEEE